MKKLLILLVLPMIGGCLLESVGPINRNIKTHADRWVKDGVSPELKKKEWLACGGRADGAVDPGLASGFKSEDYYRAYRLKRDEIAHCMLLAGYVFEPISPVTQPSPSRPE